MKLPPADSALGQLMASCRAPGAWTGSACGRRATVAMRELERSMPRPERGLDGDRYSGGSGKRGVTLIQAEHLPVIAALSGHDACRRRCCAATWWSPGMPLVALKGRRFRIGEVVLEATDELRSVLAHGGRARRRRLQRNARPWRPVRTHPRRRHDPLGDAIVAIEE